MSTVVKDLGAVSAYAYAVEKGYTGTEEEYAELMASYADVGQTAVDAKDAAIAAKTAAETASNTATTKASEASQSASQASASEQGCARAVLDAASAAAIARARADEANGYAQTASSKATEATTAAETATGAATTATTAKDDAVSAKTAAQTAQTGAETAAASVEASAAQITKNATDINELKRNLSDKANTDGTYDGMTVGSAKQILSEKYLLDEEPYLFRASGGDGSDRVEECIVGGSVGWNQLVKNGNFETSQGWYSAGEVKSFSVSNNKLTVVCNAETDNTDMYQYSHKFVSGHKYYMCFKYEKESTSVTIYGSFTSYPSGIYKAFDVPNTSGFVGVIVNAFEDVTGRFRVGMRDSAPTGEWTYSLSNVMVIDLTAMFGSTIADYIYSLEQATAGAGVAWFKKYFPDDYYEYSAPTLRHVEGVSAKQIRDSDDNVIAIYPLDSSLTLRGIPKLTDGKMWFDGDKYNADGVVGRNYIEKTINNESTLEYFAVGDNTCRAYASFYDIAPNNTTSVHIISDWETFVPDYIVNNDVEGISENKNDVSNGIWLRVAKSKLSENTIDGLKEYLSSHPITVVCQLKTPTTETATPYTALQILDPNGTEEFVSTGIVPVGHYSKYLENLRSKIEGLPKDFSTLIAPTEKAYKATRNYTVGSLLIVDNILYKVTSAIANGGTITPNTNVTATTLSEIISALAQ